MPEMPETIDFWAGASTSRDDDVRLFAARSILRVKAALRDSFPGGLVNDPVVMLLMSLFVAEMTTGAMSVGTAYAASGVTPSVAKRWLLELEKQGLITLSDDAAGEWATLSTKGYRDTARAIDAVLAAQNTLSG